MGRLGDILYNIFMFPFETAVLKGFRHKLIPDAGGEVLEIGAGTGVNLKYYRNSTLESLTMLDKNPSFNLRHNAKGIRVIDGDVHTLPFADKTFDTVLFTLVFCSVADPSKGLKEIRRVLKDTGKIIFIEHVKPHHRTAAKAADKLNPAWRTFSNGCNLNRNTLETIENSGFRINHDDYGRRGVFIKGSAVKA